MQIDPQGWTSVIAAGELHDGDPRRVDAFGIAVLLLRTDDRILAVADRCTHQGATQAVRAFEARVNEGMIELRPLS
jgi:nitrite reductase/ring-hydroxylating ferredoxin subunit